MLDLRDKLTVFVLKCGDNPNYEDCISALKKQTCEFTYFGIENYSPMSKALQMMLDLVKTPYFIQVDEDMILYPHAIETMYDVMEMDITKKYTMNCYQLRDAHLDKLIYGVKIYDTEIFKKYPYENCASCEVNQLDRMEKDGLKYSFETAIMGEHSPLWTPDLIYKRYYNLAQKYRLFNYHWMGEPLKIKLLDLCINHPSEINHYACEGYAQGLIDPLITKEKSL